MTIKSFINTSYFMMKVWCAPLLLLIFALACPTAAFAGATVSIQPNGQGGFTLLAKGLDSIIAGQIEIDYQTNNVSVPVVSAVGLGVQAALQATPVSPGVVIINLTSTRPLRGNGYLAMVQLSGQEDDPGRVTGLSAVLKSAKGVEENAATVIVNPPENGGKPPEASATDKKQIKNKPTVQAPPETVSLPVEMSPDAHPPQSGALSYHRLKGVLDRFRDFTGELTSAAIERLFAQVGDGEFQQEPAVLISDGSSEMRLTIRPTGEGGEIRCFIIKGGHSDGLQKGSAAGEWILHLVPEKGALATTVTVQGSREAVEYPLTVAPPVALFLAGTDKDGPPYVREYVTIANKRALKQ
jgi:hypothetical protein